MRPLNGEAINNRITVENNFLFCFAWALTTWKSQGLIFKGLLTIELGNSEIEHGETFVALSRAISIDNVFLRFSMFFRKINDRNNRGIQIKTKIRGGYKITALI
jgi:hypothetical protein